MEVMLVYIFPDPSPGLLTNLVSIYITTVPLTIAKIALIVHTIALPDNSTICIVYTGGTSSSTQISRR